MFPARRRRKTIWQMFARPQKRIFSKGIQGPPGGENFFKGILGKIPPEGEEIPPVGGEKHWVRMKFDVFLSKTDCLKIMFYLSKLVKLQKLWWKKFTGSYSFQFLIFFCIFCWISLKNFSNLSWSSRKKCVVSNKRCFCKNLVSAELSIFKNGHFQPCTEISIVFVTVVLLIISFVFVRLLHTGLLDMQFSLTLDSTFFDIIFNIVLTQHRISTKISKNVKIFQ